MVDGISVVGTGNAQALASFPSPLRDFLQRSDFTFERIDIEAFRAVDEVTLSRGVDVVSLSITSSTINVQAGQLTSRFNNEAIARGQGPLRSDASASFINLQSSRETLEVNFDFADDGVSVSLISERVRQTSVSLASARNISLFSDQRALNLLEQGQSQLNRVTATLDQLREFSRSLSGQLREDIFA